MTDTTTWRHSQPDSDTWVATGVRPVDVLGAVVDTVGNLDDLLWATKAPGELLDTLRTLEKLRSTVDAVQLQVVAAVDATSAAKSEGWASTKDFVTAVAGGPKGAGRRTVALAQAVTTDRTATGGLLAAGLISRAQAEVVVAAVDRLPVNPALRDAAERLLLLEARDHDATDLARRGRYVVERLDPDGTDRRDEKALDREERAAHLSRFLSVVEDGIGGVRLKGRGTVEDAAWLKAVLFPLAAPRPTAEPGSCGGTPVAPGDSSAGRRRGDRPGACGVADCAHDGQDPREHGARMWDALIEASKLLAGTEILPESHGARPRITVTIDHDTLVAGLTDGPASRAGGGLLDSGGSLSVTAVRRLACDAEILPDGARVEVADPRRRTLEPARHPGHLAGPGRPGRALRLPRLHPRAGGLRRPPHHPLGRGRSDCAAQPRAAVPPAPHGDPHHPLGRPAASRRPETRVPPTRTSRSAAAASASTTPP